MNMTRLATHATETRVRRLRHGDLPDLLRLEAEGDPHPWGEERLAAFFTDHLATGLVTEEGGEVVGFLLARHEPDNLEVVKLVVAPHARRRKIGSRLLARLGEGLGRIRVDVPETDLEACLFLKSLGFRAIGIRQGEVGAGDVYLFRYQSSLPATAGVPG
jgi:ribosomal-protein-alanine N-acetyltransferase